MADGINDNAGTGAGGIPADVPMDAASALEAEVNDLDISPFSDPEPEPEPDIEVVVEPEQQEGKGEQDPPSEGEAAEGEGEPGTTPPEGTPTEGEGTKEPAATEGDEPSQIEKLLARINELQGQLNQQQSGIPPVVEPQAPAADPNQVQPPAPQEGPGEIDFVGQIDMDDVASDPAVFNKVLNAVVQKTQLQAAEQVLLAIPHVIAAQVQQQSGINKAINDFYSENPDLRNVSKVVQATAQQIALEKPESDMTSLLKEAAVKTREVLGLTAPVISGSETIPPPNAGQAGLPTPPGGSTRGKPQLSSLQAEIDEL